MTIAVAVKTSLAVVFAADSKVTTKGIVGLDGEGKLIWQEQTFDNATKVVHDRRAVLMAMIAGHANIGQVSATDFIATREFLHFDLQENQDEAINKLLGEMAEEKRSYWASTQAKADSWPGPTLLLAAPAAGQKTPRVWHASLQGESYTHQEILAEPGVRLEGSYDEVFHLLYGYNPSMLDAIRRYLQLGQDKMNEALDKMPVLRSIDKLNLYAMPLQDAIDFAVFLATVQVQMDRFLPGIPVCGGPIDVMVLQLTPEPKILAFPGKVIHHPINRPTW